MEGCCQFLTNTYLNDIFAYITRMPFQFKVLCNRCRKEGLLNLARSLTKVEIENRCRCVHCNEIGALSFLRSLEWKYKINMDNLFIHLISHLSKTQSRCESLLWCEMIFAHTRDPPFYYKIGAKISRKFKSQNDLAKLEPNQIPPCVKTWQNFMDFRELNLGVGVFDFFC